MRATNYRPHHQQQKRFTIEYMRVLVACEFSGVVREAFRARGHSAWSCDLLPAEDGSKFHYHGDVFSMLPGGHIYQTMALEGQQTDWDMMIAHPPCTYLCGSGIHWNKRRPERAALTIDALKFVEKLWNAGISRIAIENPVGILSTRSILGKPAQIIQPHQFGHDASKATCLWLKGLPPMQATCHIPPRIINGKKRWGNQTDSGQNKLAPSENRWKDRSRTYQGIADAMAAQWDF